MAEFLERRKVVKKEKQLSGRVGTVIRQTNKKRYRDAIDEDLKVTQESQQLASELQGLSTIREAKASKKKLSAAIREAKNKDSGKTAVKPAGSNDGYNFDALEK